GDYRMYGLYEGDSLLFAQYFDDHGNIVRELFNGVAAALDTSQWEDPRIVLPSGNTLRAGEANPCRIVLPKVPSAFIAYSCPDGVISYDAESDPFPLVITPHESMDVCRLYLRIKTHDNGGYAVMRRMTLMLD
ncbi:MAG: hypothetical protein AAFV07_15050, partial [Bacteroidota bacterium]